MVKKKRKQLIRRPIVEQRDAIQVPQSDWERQLRQTQINAGKDPYIPNQDEHYLNGSVYSIKYNEFGWPVGIIMNDNEEVPKEFVGEVLKKHSKLSDAWDEGVANYQKWLQSQASPTTVSSFNGVKHTDKEREDYTKQQKALERQKIGKEGMNQLLEYTMPSYYVRKLATAFDAPTDVRDAAGLVADLGTLVADPASTVAKGAAGKVAKTAAKVGKAAAKGARASVRDLTQEAMLARKYSGYLYGGLPIPMRFSVDDALTALRAGAPENDVKSIMNIIGGRSSKEQARFWYEVKRMKLAEGSPQQSIIENTPWFKKFGDSASVHPDGTVFIINTKSPYVQDIYEAVSHNPDMTKGFLDDVIERAKEKFRRKPKAEEPPVTPTTETPITEIPLNDLKDKARTIDPTTATGKELSEELDRRMQDLDLEDLVSLTGDSEAKFVKKLAQQHIESKLSRLDSINKWKTEMSKAIPESPTAKLLDEEYKKFLHNKPVSSYYTEDLPAVIAAESPNSQRWNELNEMMKQRQAISVNQTITTPTGQSIVIKGETTDNKISSPYNDVFTVNKEGNITGVDTINPANYNRYFNTSKTNKYGMQPFTITNEGRVVPNDPLEGVGLFNAPSQFFTAPRREGGFFNWMNQKLLGKPTKPTSATQFYLNDGHLTSNINVPQVGGGRQISIPRTLATSSAIGVPAFYVFKAVKNYFDPPEDKIKFDDKLYDLFKGKDGLQYAIDPTKNFNNIGEASSNGEYNYGYLIGQDGNIGSDRVLFHRMPNGKWEFLDQQNANDLKVKNQNQDLPEDQTPIDSSTIIQSTPIYNQPTQTESKPVQQQESTPVQTQDSWRDEQAFVYPSVNKFFRNEYYI